MIVNAEARQDKELPATVVRKTKPVLAVKRIPDYRGMGLLWDRAT